MSKIAFIALDTEFSDGLTKFLRTKGFEVELFSKPQKIAERLVLISPSIIIIDYLQQINNVKDILNQIKSNETLRSVPSILLVPKGHVEDIVSMVESGLDDYIEKPFDFRILFVRIKVIQKWLDLAKGLNPLTSLPGNVSINSELQKHIEQNKPTAVMYIDLDHFKPYNDVYGFIAGDRVIKFLGEILKDASSKMGHRDDFVGHIGGDDFILITIPNKAETVGRYIIQMFDREVAQFYDEADLSRGFIVAPDRDDEVKQFPFLSLSIAVVSNDKRHFKSVEFVSKIATDMKKYAKSFRGSSLVREDQNGEEGSFENLTIKTKSQHHRKKKILLVAIDLYLRNFISKVLISGEHIIIAEHDSTSALNKLLEEKIDLVIFDMDMPKLNGLEFYERIKDINKIKHIPYVLLATNSSKEFIIQFAKSGIKKYISKPLKAPEFIKVVNETLGVYYE